MGISSTTKETWLAFIGERELQVGLCDWCCTNLGVCASRKWSMRSLGRGDFGGEVGRGRGRCGLDANARSVTPEGARAVVWRVFQKICGWPGILLCDEESTSDVTKRNKVHVIVR